jgi:Cdc6-like AAA superfamily ATPase
MEIVRLLEHKINDMLTYCSAILLNGAKGIGKTKIAKNVCKSYISLDDANHNTLEIASINPLKILEGEKPRAIDE